MHGHVSIQLAQQGGVAFLLRAFSPEVFGCRQPVSQNNALSKSTNVGELCEPNHLSIDSASDYSRPQIRSTEKTMIQSGVHDILFIQSRALFLSIGFRNFASVAINARGRSRLVEEHQVPIHGSLCRVARRTRDILMPSLEREYCFVVIEK